MKSLLIVFGAFLMIICLPAFFQATHDARVESATETFAGVTTGAGVYSANVTLAQEAYDDTVNAVDSISSNVTADTPAASTYNSTSRVLLVTGLAPSVTHTLTVNYDVTTTLLPIGMSVFLTVVNWFYIFAILGMLGGAIYAFFD